MEVCVHPSRHDKVLRATKSFLPGDIIFTEHPALHTVSAPKPASSLEYLPDDFHALVLQYISLKSSDSLPEADEILKLSTDGVTSEIANMVDAERAKDYHLAAKHIVSKWKAKQKKKKKIPTYQPTVSEIEKLIQIIETNCHSIPSESEDEPDICGVFLLASMMEHSCFQNSNVSIRPTSESIELTLTATRKIEIGDLITINYQDNDFQPTKIRRSGLLRRGFLCCCEICDENGKVQDYCRTAYCERDGCDGFVSPHGEGKEYSHWKCDTCNQGISKQYFSLIIAKEDSLTPKNESNEELEDIYTKIFKAIVETIQLSASIPCPPSSASIILNTKQLIYPLTPHHWLIYGTLKSTVFDNSSFTEMFGRESPFYAIYYLLAVNIVADSEWIKSGKCSFYREETNHHLSWMKKLLDQFDEIRERNGTLMTRSVSQPTSTALCDPSGVPIKLTVSDECCVSPNFNKTGWDNGIPGLTNYRQGCPCNEGTTGIYCNICDPQNSLKIGTTSRQLGIFSWPYDKCQLCGCNKENSLSTNCTLSATQIPQCSCKPGFTGNCNQCVSGLVGPTCTQCAPNMFKSLSTNSLCCQCDPNGAVDPKCYGSSGILGNSTVACQCKPGFKGTKCSECANGGVGSKCEICPTGTSVTNANGTVTCSKCDCNAVGSTGLCDASGICTCKSGFSGTKCDKCADGLNGFPNCNGNLFLQNMDIIIAVGSAVLVIAGLFFFMKKKWPDSDNGKIFTIVLTLFDFVSDILFLTKSITSVDTLGLVVMVCTIVVVIVPFIVSLIWCSLIIIKELKENAAFRDWTKKNAAIISGAGFLASTNAEVLGVVGSKMFGMDALSAPLSEGFLRRVNLATLANIFIEDLGQFGVSIWILLLQGPNKRNFQTVLVTLISALSIVHGILSRVFLKYALSKHVDTSYPTKLNKIDSKYDHNVESKPPTQKFPNRRDDETINSSALSSATVYNQSPQQRINYIPPAVTSPSTPQSYGNFYGGNYNERYQNHGGQQFHPTYSTQQPNQDYEYGRYPQYNQNGEASEWDDLFDDLDAIAPIAANVENSHRDNTVEENNDSERTENEFSDSNESRRNESSDNETDEESLNAQKTLSQKNIPNPTQQKINLPSKKLPQSISKKTSSTSGILSSDRINAIKAANQAKLREKEQGKKNHVIALSLDETLNLQLKSKKKGITKVKLLPSTTHGKPIRDDSQHRPQIAATNKLAPSIPANTHINGNKSKPPAKASGTIMIQPQQNLFDRLSPAEVKLKAIELANKAKEAIAEKNRVVREIPVSKPRVLSYKDGVDVPLVGKNSSVKKKPGKGIIAKLRKK
ncbi:Laminin subunit beta-3 [Nowakowskiella sp. JEL0407]|nr:Laminin subunit beta-3 [Nowakowskiella sp. JEL0407]